MKYNSIVDAIDAHIDNLVASEVIADDSIKSQDIAIEIQNLNTVYSEILEEDPPTITANTVSDQVAVLLGYIEKFIAAITADTPEPEPEPDPDPDPDPDPAPVA